MVLSKYNKRDDSIAIAKAIGIILVVVGHCSYISGYQKILCDFIYMFHMPLFFILSGYFFKMKYIDNKILFVNKKIKGLYLPYIEWLTAFILLHNLFCVINVYDDSVLTWGASIYSYSEILRRIKCTVLMDFGGGCERLLGGFWFIPVLFISSIISLFSLYVSNLFFRKCQTLGVIVVMIIFVISSMLMSYFNISFRYLVDSRILLASAMFLSGFLANWFNLFAKRDKAILFIFISVIIILPLSQMHYVCIGGVWEWYDAVYLLFLGFVGTWMTVCMSFLLLKTRFKELLIYIGENTLIILALHLLCFKLVTFVKVVYYGLAYAKLSSIPILYDVQSRNNIIWWILYIVMGIGLPLVIKSGCDKLKVKIVSKRGI